MENVNEVCQQISELLNTVQEGFLHVKERCVEGAFQETVELFRDITSAVLSLTVSIRSVELDSGEGTLETNGGELIAALEGIYAQYQENNQGKALEILQFTALPAFYKWKAEMERRIEPYLLVN